jgi:hypothetical protein
MTLTVIWLKLFVAPKEARLGDAAVMKMNIAPYETLEMIETQICAPTAIQTAVEYPCFLAKIFMMGNRAKAGKDDIKPPIKTFFEPRRSCIFAKKQTWRMPINIPRTERSFPIVGGARPRPPIEMGVARKTGWIARKVMSTR